MKESENGSPTHCYRAPQGGGRSVVGVACEDWGGERKANFSRPREKRLGKRSGLPFHKRGESFFSAMLRNNLSGLCDYTLFCEANQKGGR